MATVQTEFGGIELFEDFCGPEWIIAETAASGQIGAFRVIGQGTETDDSGVTINETAPCLSGVARFTTTDEDLHSVGLTTALVFDVTLCAPLVLECRVQFAALTTKQFFFGLSDVNSDTAILESTGGIVNIATGAPTTIAYTASDVCGFLFSSEATHKDWHAVYAGGTETSETTSTSVDLEEDPTAGEWQILRLEVDPNGTARWFVDGALKKTLAGAVSLTTDLAAQAILENLANTSTTETCDVDYILVTANRDWTV